MSRYQRGGEVTRATSRPKERRRGNRIFYVVAEGERTEYDYLGYLNQFYGSDLRFFIQSLSQRQGLPPARVIDKAHIGREPGVVRFPVTGIHRPRCTFSSKASELSHGLVEKLQDFGRQVTVPGPQSGTRVSG